MNIGRTDLIDGSYEETEQSIRKKLYKLKDETVVIPGHGAFTQIGFEKKNNMFFVDNGADEDDDEDILKPNKTSATSLLHTHGRHIGICCHCLHHEAHF